MVEVSLEHGQGCSRREQLDRQQQRRRDRHEHGRRARARPGSRSRTGRRSRAVAVCVMPRNEPANISVAPNSPSARPHASARPAARPGRATGTATRTNAAASLEPSVRDASRRDWGDGLERRLGLADVERSRDEDERDDDAGGLQDERDPGVIRTPPSSPSGPSAASSPIPATAGGSTSGSSISVITMRARRNVRVASR